MKGAGAQLSDAAVDRDVERLLRDGYDPRFRHDAQKRQERCGQKRELNR